MNIVQRYAIRTVFGVYVIALLLFAFALQLVEAVTNLVRYIQLSVPLLSVLKLQLFLLPSSIHFALPISMLFAVSFSIGHFNSTRELLAVFGIGISLTRFCMYIFIFAALMSISSFILENTFVVSSRASYQSLRESILLINPTTDSEFVAIFGGDGNDVYYAEYYDSSTRTLLNPTFIERNLRGAITRRISADSATWDGEYWILKNTHSYTWNDSITDVTHRVHGRVRIPNLQVTPESFENAELRIEEMTLQQAGAYIATRRKSGLPFRKELTIYHKRFSFACTSLVVAIISCGIGSLLRRDALLMSMLLSLSVTIVYYVLGLIIDVLAFNGYINPVVAAWTPISLFSIGGGFALKKFAHS